MKTTTRLGAFSFALFLFAGLAQAQTATNWLPGRVLVKLLPDYLRPRVYALNQSFGTNNGTLLSLNATNGATISEITLGINPTDMAMTPAGDALYVINTGSRTISKVNLSTFAVAAEKSISTPNTYSASNPLHIAAGRSNLVYFTDGGWAPSITTFNYAAGTNVSVYDDGNGAGGIAVTRNGNILYRWRQYGWGAGNVNSWVTRYDASGSNLSALEDSFTSWRRDPYDTPVLIDGAEGRVFNKQQMFAADNVATLLTEFSEDLYAISFDGSLALGASKVFNSLNGSVITNFAFSATVQTLSGDQKKLFRYRSNTSDLFVYDMSAIASVSGPSILPTPADGSVVGLPPTNLIWSVSPVALSYDVYFGTSLNQVSSAQPGSPNYLGRVTSPEITLAQPLVAGATYFWRVDPVGFISTNAGPVWSFTVSPIAISPAQLTIGAIAGFNPSSQTLNLASAAPHAWSATVSGGNWLSLNVTNGSSPTNLVVSFNTAALAAAAYTNQIEFTIEGKKVRVPVTMEVKPLNIVKMTADYQRPYIYAIQAPVLSGQNGQLLFINTTTEKIEKTLPIGINPVDLTVHYGEGRLYIASWTENATYVVDLATQTLLPSLHLGTDVYKINAGKPGRIVIEGEDQWIGVSIIDTATGANVGSMPWPQRQGDGEMDPTGTIYYHSDDNISNAHIHKHQLAGDVATEVAGSLEHPYGSRNLVLAPDGTRLFWRGYVYDANLNELGNLGEEIYGTTAHGDLALGGSHVFNSQNGQTLYTWPFSTSVLAVSGDQQKVFIYNSTAKQMTVVPMSSIASVPGPGLNPTPADGIVINPPLPQVSWTASTFALSYRVFVGTNKSAVASANTSSSTYLGTTASNRFSLPFAVTPGLTYYWRVDSVGFSTTTTGAVWSFHVAPLNVSPQMLSLKGVVGLPVPPQTIAFTAPSSTSWNLTIEQPWLSASAASGVTPSTVTLSLNTTNLAAGFYTNQVTINAGGVALKYPVVIQLFSLNASRMVADPKRNVIYALHPGSGNFEDAFLLFLNTDSGQVEKVIPVGTNPTDMSVNPREDRLYISNWQHNQTHVVDLVTRTELTPLSLGTDVYKINGGLAGRIVVEGEDQWIYASLINSGNGSTITSMMVREGDGEFDPSGRYYYHVDNNSSGATIQKYDTGNNSFVPIGSAGPHYYYGSRNLVMSLDGSRLFWTSAVYDANLVDLGVLGAEIYASSTNGRVAFSDHQAFDTSTRQVIYNLPASSSVMAVDRRNQRLWYFNSATHAIESLALSTILSPSITQQPATNTPAAIGNNVYLSVSAMGIAPLSYQWQMAGTNLPAATNYFLSINGIQPFQEGDYQVVVQNPYGAVTSTVAHVSVIISPAITSQPQSTNVLAGQSVVLTATASGSSPLAYQWTFEGVKISAATNATLFIVNAQSMNEGIYRMIAQNSAGSVTSSIARVRVTPAAPTIVSAPASVLVPASSNVTFSVAAVGSQPMSYQWFFNEAPIPGAKAAQYSINNVQAPHAGNYRVTVTNAAGSAASSIATLTVSPVAPYFVLVPIGSSAPAGTNLTLVSLAKGSEPIAYQWQRDGTNLFETNASLTLTNLGIADSGAYRVLASNIVGVSTSAVADIIITSAPPVFLQQPASVALLAGSSTTLNSLAAGSNPLIYQWHFQNNPLPNQTNRQLALAAITTASAGQYFVIASNSFGVATSLVAQVTVNQRPVLLQSLTNQVVDINDTVTLSVLAEGTEPLSYTWQFNNTTVPQAGSSTLIVTNIQPGQSGYYRVTIGNQFGSVSSTGRVSVLGVPSWVKAWGDNSGGQTEVPENLDDVVAVAGGDFHTLALRHDGSLIAWGFGGDGQTSVPDSLHRFVSIAAGTAHNLALLEDGSVVAWGRNESGQTNVPASVKSALAIAAGDSHSLALLSSGTVVGWGDNSYGQAVVPPNLTGVRAIAAGRIHNLALRSNGTVVGWGYNGYGESTPPQTLNGVTAIAAGYLHSAALRSNGTVVVWGDNSYGQTNMPSGLSNVVAIAAGDFHTLALRSDGSVIGWGDDFFDQTEVPADVFDSVAVASGSYHGLALVPVVPLLQSQLLPGRLVIQWNGPGILQWAPSPTGPFSDVPCFGRCYTNLDLSAPAKFFRLRK